MSDPVILTLHNRENGVTAFVKYKFYPASDSILVYTVTKNSSGETVGKIAFKVPLTEIRKIVFDRLNNKLGWGWSDVKNSAKKITRKVGTMKMLLTVKKIMEDPRFEKGAKLASTIYPPLGITYGSVRVAAKLVDKASKGSVEAKQKIALLKEEAMSGNPQAIKSMRAMIALYDLKTNKGVNISGWADDLYAKSVEVNKPPERTNFINKMRSMYRAGIIDTTAKVVK